MHNHNRGVGVPAFLRMRCRQTSARWAPEVVLLTGDSKTVGDIVAEELNIESVLAEVLPEDKDRVAMVGDGAAPALITGDIGITINAQLLRRAI